jgi:hypothetical protein
LAHRFCGTAAGAERGKSLAVVAGLPDTPAPTSLARAQAIEKKQLRRVSVRQCELLYSSALIRLSPPAVGQDCCMGVSALEIHAISCCNAAAIFGTTHSTPCHSPD